MPRPPPTSTYSSGRPARCRSVAIDADKGGGAPQRFDARHLRPDVHVHGHQLQKRPAVERREQLARGVERHAELVDLEPGRNVRMAPGVDVGVDADGDAGGAAETCGDGLDPRQLASRLHVDRLQPERHGCFELRWRLADAGEDDVVRLEPHATGDIDLPDGVRVGGAPEIAQQAADRQVRVRLQRVVQGVRIAAKRVIQGAEAAADFRRAVDVQRRALGGSHG